jgi:hypothetical protein
MRTDWKKILAAHLSNRLTRFFFSFFFSFRTVIFVLPFSQLGSTHEFGTSVDINFCVFFLTEVGSNFINSLKYILVIEILHVCSIYLHSELFYFLKLENIIFNINGLHIAWPLLGVS